MHTSSTSYKQLQPENRLTIASLRQQNLNIRRISMVLKRSPSTISRELTRNRKQGTYATISAM